MNEGINKVIGRGITGDELEKQLQEELGDVNLKSSEKIKDNLEKEISNQTETISEKANYVEKTYEEIGGEEGVKQVLDKMEPSQKEELSLLLENKLKTLIAEKSKMNQGLGNTIYKLTPNFIEKYEVNEVNLLDIMGAISGFITGLAGSIGAHEGLLGKQLQDFMNSMEGNATLNQLFVAVIGALLVPIAFRVGATTAMVPAITGVAMHAVSQIPSRLANLGKTMMTKFQLRIAKNK